MLDTDARVAAVNARAARLRKRKERRIDAALAASCAVICLGLFGVARMLSEHSSIVSVHELYGASSMLGADVGGYVVVALISFSLAVIVTVLCLRRRRSDSSGSDDAFALHNDGRKGDEQ